MMLYFVSFFESDQTQDANKKKFAQNSLKWSLENLPDFVKIFEPKFRLMGITEDVLAHIGFESYKKEAL